MSWQEESSRWGKTWADSWVRREQVKAKCTKKLIVPKIFNCTKISNSSRNGTLSKQISVLKKRLRNNLKSDSFYNTFRRLKYFKSWMLMRFIFPFLVFEMLLFAELDAHEVEELIKWIKYV